MAAERADAGPRADELDDIILAYVEAAEAGQTPDRAAWLKRYPQFADELADFFADQDQFSSLVAPIATEAPRPSLSSSRLAQSAVLDAAPPPAAGSVVGDYELLDEVASGGMGVVYKARHRTLGRVVALKMIRTATGPTLPEDVARFRLEAEAAAALDHPNIVPIYGVGEHEGQPYFTMKLIEGGSLAARPRDTRPRAAARLVAAVARAVHHAHQRGILHRDLKPGNILLDAQGEPHVTDFGLATRLAAAAPAADASLTPFGLTQKGIAVGTPGYMAPEQAHGPKKRVTVAADVYSLGAVLYELLTGRPPFKGGSPLETLVQVLEQQPPRPRELNARVPRDLEAICLKCLSKEPGTRYAGADALADDLQRFLDGQPVHARAAGPAGRLWRWGRRSPVVAGLTGALLLGFLMGLSLVTLMWRRAEEHFKHAEEWRLLTEKAMLKSEENFEKADAARKEVEAQRQRAEAHRKEAEENFQQAHQIVDRFYQRLGEDRLFASQGLQPLRKEMFEIGLKYYQDFVAKRGDDPALKADLAKAHLQVALFTGQVGSKRDALASYDQALRIYEELLAAHPDNDNYREQVAVTCLNRGGIAEALNDKDGALANYRRGRQLLEDLDRARPQTPRVLARLGRLYNNLGNVNRRLNRLDDAGAAYDKALAVQERLTRKDPSDVHPQRELAAVYVNVAILHAARGEKDEALRWHERARALQEKLLHDHPDDREVQHDLALTYRRIGERLVRDGKVADGTALLEKGHKLMRELADANTSVTDYQWELALSHRALGDARKADGKNEQALASYSEAVFLLRRARRQDQSAAVYGRDLALSLLRRGVLLSADAARADEALRDYAAAADLFRKLWPDDADELCRIAAEQADTAARVGGGKKDLSAAERAARAAYLDQAMETLRLAVRAGFGDADRLRKDAGLAPLRGREDFQKLVEGLKK